MLKLHRTYLICAALGLALMPFPYAALGISKTIAEWRWFDILCEGGTAAMALTWLLIMLSSRPGGVVTRLFALGLTGIMLGSWADCMDEFWRVPKTSLWDNWLEGLLPAGMALLTAGMVYWRHEQFSLNEHLQKRERLFREHRAFDRLTQLAGADYLRSQIRAEYARSPGQACALVLLDIDGFHRINREHGQREGDRVLQAVGHMLLLNLRNDDLLCRYAGDRFALLLPATDAAQADALARHLCAMVEAMRHHGANGPVPVRLRHACTLLEGAPEALLAELAQAVDLASAAAAGAPPGGASAPLAGRGGKLPGAAGPAAAVVSA